MPSGSPIPVVVQQHVEESAILRSNRSVLVRAPHVKLHHLRRLDDRIAAHLDGVAVAGEFGWTLAEAALERPGTGELFCAVVRAIEDRNSAGLAKLLALAEAVPDAWHGVMSAFGWVSAQSLRGITKALLDSPDPFQRHLGLTSCTMHQVDPGKVLEAMTGDTDTRLRAAALKAAGVLGRTDLLSACVAALADLDDDCRFEAARAALLLGNRDRSLKTLYAFAAKPGRLRTAALQLWLKAAPSAQVHAMLTALSRDEKNPRLLILGAGISGDPHYVPWLIKQMETLELARLAGESFSFITGLDLAYLDLERKPPEGVEFGPTDDPDDEDVAMDEDDSLPWPDPERLAAWWREHGSSFAAGTRYFVGQPPVWLHCVQVLKEGYQRQRTAAAQYLCLLRPGTVLFNTAAPAWRQKRLLDRMN